MHEGAKALDVGSGSGILTACFARMVRAVFGVFFCPHSVIAFVKINKDSSWNTYYFDLFWGVGGLQVMEHSTQIDTAKRRSLCVWLPAYLESGSSDVFDMIFFSGSWDGFDFLSWVGFNTRQALPLDRKMAPRNLEVLSFQVFLRVGNSAPNF